MLAGSIFRRRPRHLHRGLRPCAIYLVLLVVGRVPTTYSLPLREQLTAELALSRSTSEMRAAWSCYSPYLSYVGISCPTGRETGSVDVKTLYDAAMKSERLDEVFAGLKDYLQARSRVKLNMKKQ